MAKSDRIVVLNKYRNWCKFFFKTSKCLIDLVTFVEQNFERYRYLPQSTLNISPKASTSTEIVWKIHKRIRIKSH